MESILIMENKSDYVVRQIDVFETTSTITNNDSFPETDFGLIDEQDPVTMMSILVIVTHCKACITKQCSDLKSSRRMKHDHHWLRCGLREREEPVVNAFIDTGIFIEARRRFYHFIMLSPGHPQARIYYRSHLQRRREHMRQMTKYQSTIHPFSKCNIYWEYLVSCSLMVDGIYRILLAAYSWGVESTVVLRRVIMAMDILLLCDVIMRFFIGYYDSEANRSVLEKKGIAKHYLKTYFFCDVIASGYTTLFFMRKMAIKNLHEWTVVLGIIRIVRVPRIFAAFNVFRLRSSLSSFVTTTITTLLVLWVLTTFSYILIFTVENMIEFIFYQTTRWEEFNIFRLYKSTIFLLCVGFEGSVEGAQMSFQISSIFFVGWGMWINTLTLVYITHVWTTSRYDRSKDLMYLEFQQYVRSVGMPQGLRVKFFGFLGFKFNNRLYNERYVTKTASTILKDQLHRSVTKVQLDNVDVFRNVPAGLLNGLVAKFRTEIFLTNDVIIVAGVPGDCMYFINYGTVAIYSLAGIFLALLIFLSVAGNILVCVAIYTDRGLRRIGNLFLASLAIADLFVASLVMTFAGVNDILGYWIFGAQFCDTWVAFDVMCSTASILNLCAISLDRYIHIKDPLRYGRWVTRRVALITIAAIWLLAALISFVPISLGLHRPPQPLVYNAGGQHYATCALDLTPTYAVVSSCISFYVPCIVMLGIYCRLYCYAQKHVQNIRAITRPIDLPADTISKKKSTKKQKNKALHIHLHNHHSSPYHVSDHKAAVTVGIIMGVFLICWVPFFCINIVAAFCKTCIPDITFKILTWLGYSNSAFNPIIYSIFNTEFREAFKRILTAHYPPCCKCGYQSVSLNNDKFITDYGLCTKTLVINARRNGSFGDFSSERLSFDSVRQTRVNSEKDIMEDVSAI